VKQIYQLSVCIISRLCHYPSRLVLVSSVQSNFDTTDTLLYSTPLIASIFN